MFRLFEKALNPTEPPAQSQPPAALVAFYWHFARQAKGLFVALFVAGFIVAVLDASIPAFMGRIVTLVTSSKPETLWTDNWPHAARPWRSCCCCCARWRMMAQNLVSNQAIAVNVANMIRWQNHWHVARQSWAFFQNDFAGRIANRVMQTGPAVRESLVALITGVWYILVYGTAALILLASADRLARAADRALVRRLHRDAARVSCRACATAPRRCRRRAPGWSAASSTPTPTS